MTFEVKKLAAAMLAVGSLTMGLQSAQALPTTPAPLEGRTITGARVDAYDPSAVMEYDPNLNITWLRDWGASGLRSWQDATNWLLNLNVGEFSNWSLPSAFTPIDAPWCNGIYGCVHGQIGYMYYVELGNTRYTNQYISGPFTDTYGGYWISSGALVAGGDVIAWDPINPRDLKIHAVRAGDVAAIPEPETWAMMLMGLAAAAVTLRKRS